MPDDLLPRGSGAGNGVPTPTRPLQPSPSWDAASWDGWDDDQASER